ncbi:hypothetical protein QTP88_025314 [Uroleucon formosanum]
MFERRLYKPKGGCRVVRGAAAVAGEEQLQRDRRSPRTTATAAEPYSTHGRRPRSPPPQPPPPPLPPSAQVPQTLDSRRHTVTERVRVSSVALTHDTVVSRSASLSETRQPSSVAAPIK